MKRSSIIIAHRGNLNGPDPQENNPVYLQKTLDQGFDVEVDVWLKDRQLWTGHDNHQWSITEIFLVKPRVWVHAKTVETFSYLAQSCVNMFYQTDEEIVVTTNGYVWHHSKNKDYGRKSIITHLGANKISIGSAVGICTDYADTYSELLVKNKQPFDVLVLDVDGVLNSCKTYSFAGVISKDMKDIDFTAIKRFKAAGIKVCFLSSDLFNEKIAQDRKIDFFYAERSQQGEHILIDKSLYLEKICNYYNTTPDRLAFIGDDYYDISLLTKVGLPLCPANAPMAVQEVTDRALSLYRNGGEGVVAELYDLVREDLDEQYPYDNL